MGSRAQRRVELTNSVRAKLPDELAEQLVVELHTLFPNKGVHVLGYLLFDGFDPNQWRKVVLAVETKDLQGPGSGRHVVKIGETDAVASDFRNWLQCTRTKKVSGRMFMQVRMLELPPIESRAGGRAGVVYEDATPLYGPLRADEDVLTLADAALICVKNNEIDVTSIERVLRQTYAELGRWFFDDATAQPLKVDEFYRRKLQFGQPVPVLARWKSGNLARLRADAIWLLSCPLPPKLNESPPYADPIEYLEWIFQQPPEMLPSTLIGRSHGDFHGQNILVGKTRGEVEYPIIIDYGDMGTQNAIVWDFVKQEIELKVRLLYWLIKDETTRDAVLETTKAHQFTKLISFWKKKRNLTPHEESNRAMLFAYLFEDLLNARSSHFEPDAATEYRQSTREDGRTSLDRALAMLVRIRLEASIQLARNRSKPADWREEYQFGLVIYGVSTAKFLDNAYYQRMRSFALISSGYAVSRLASYRTKITELASSQPSKDEAPEKVRQHPSNLISIHHASVFWKRREFDVAANILRQARETFPHAIHVHREFALLLTSLGRPNEANDALAELDIRYFGDSGSATRTAITERCRAFGDFETLSRFGAAFKKLGDQSWEIQQPLTPFAQLKSIPAYQHYCTALDYYQEAFDFSQDHYPGGNAAVSALMSQQRELARRLADDVSHICSNVRLSALTSEERHWLFSTEATMALIRDDADAAVNFQHEALKSMPKVPIQYLQTSYNQLCRLWHVLDKSAVERVIKVIEQSLGTGESLNSGPLGNCNRTFQYRCREQSSGSPTR